MKKIAIPAVTAALIALTSTSCALKVYLVDRQTVLEDEAAGEWPEFEKEILQKSSAQSPTPFQTVAASARKARLFNILNGELESTGRTQASVASASSSLRSVPGATSAAAASAPAGK